jgi:UDP-N-acetylmuramoylalanine--D-glutamate ligase
MNAARKINASAKDLVLGLGATGLSVARYLRRKELDAIFADSRDEPPGLNELQEAWPGAEVLRGATKLPKNANRIIVSPGIADSDPILKAARKAKLEIISDIELFTREASAPFIAVTGSNGKSTVTTLLYHMCRAAGHHVLAGGNLGEPALDLLDQAKPDFYILELSSFQLQRTESLPTTAAVLLNVSPDHLDWHASEDEYRQSKYRIFREARAAVINRADEESANRVKKIKSVISFGLDEPAESQFGVRNVEGVDYLARGEQLLIATNELKMYGLHNQANALAALATGELIGLEISAMLQVLNEFPGLPHRMQFVTRVGAVDYINDSKATNVAAAVASIDSVSSNLVLIAGGDGKGGEFDDLVAALENKLRAAVLIGKDAEKISAALDTVMPVYFAQDMDDAVAQAASYAESDDTVLLAPACASLDQYDDYAARGDAFCAAAKALQR